MERLSFSNISYHQLTTLVERRSSLLEARSGGTLQGCSVESQQHATLRVDIHKLSQDGGIRRLYGLERELS